ncbi:MAG TPA: Fic family protein [Solirubrobacteraceae bacterium]|nr:Fic family protein [Solirubrobacteraceae bacterium]
MADPYVYPGTAVLRNLAGLKDAGALVDHEAQVSTLRLAQLAALRLEGAYDLTHLKRFHRFIFQDVYSWAGELRSVPLAKPGSMFALPAHIESYATQLLSQLAAERHLSGLSRERFVELLTYYYAELNAIHPFREGNGRAQRAFLRQLALDAGHTLAWEHLDSQALVHASQRSFQGDNLPMRELIEAVLDPLVR